MGEGERVRVREAGRKGKREGGREAGRDGGRVRGREGNREEGGGMKALESYNEEEEMEGIRKAS